MKSYLKTILFFALIINYGCEKDTTTFLSFENHTEEFKGECSDKDCPKVTIDYCKIIGAKEISEKINFIIGNTIIYNLKSNFEKNIKASTVSEAAKGFIETYEKDKIEFPELSPYIAEIAISKMHSTPKILSIKAESYTYTGGAHGNGTVKFLNFDPQTGTLKSTSSLFKDKEEFKSFAENKFRISKEISAEESINSTGFWFENEKFYLPETIGLSPAAVILIYNPYEIASYADGFIELKIPMDEAKPYLNF